MDVKGFRNVDAVARHIYYYYEAELL